MLLLQSRYVQPYSLARIVSQRVNCLGFCLGLDVLIFCAVNIAMLCDFRYSRFSLPPAFNFQLMLLNLTLCPGLPVNLLDSVCEVIDGPKLYLTC